eukprot:SAG22_NODE_181_length_16048_cov_157.464418_13_plen_56_part_00
MYIDDDYSSDSEPEQGDFHTDFNENGSNNDEHGSIDWMVKTSSLDPEERVVTQHL